MNAPATYELEPRCPIDFKSITKDEPLVYDNIASNIIGTLSLEIRDIAARSRQSHASINRGGWKSTNTLFQTYGNYAAIRELHAILTEMIGARPSFSWAMINANGSEHPRHQHTGAIVTTLLYIEPGDPHVPTVFECPDGSVLDVMPHPGRLVVSRGEMWHGVPRYNGTTPRITLVCDYRSGR